MGTVLGGLLLPKFSPFDLGGTLEQANRIAAGQTGNQTALLTLADLKAKQEAEQLFLEQVKNNPELARQLLGDGSVLGSLGQGPGGMPGAPPGAITQGTLGPGGVGGTATPGAPGLSPRGFAPEGAQPQQSILASLGPQGGMPGPPQGPPQGPQNPALAMATQNPRAALLMQQQLQASQDRQWKLHEQQMSMGVKIAEYVARELQGVTDQASLDQARERIRQVHPQAASQVPQTYSKEGVESVQQRGVAIAERARWDKDMATAQKTREETRLLPELFKDAGTSGESPTQTPPNGAASPPTGTQARPAPPEYDSAITEANTLYPQVSTARIKSIIAAESSYDAKAESSKGAKGPMGLMDDTAREMGVKDSFNVQENVRGGTRYYAQLLTKYGGDERKALTAYNWGMGNFAKAGDDVTKAPPETQAYVAKVLGGGGGGGAGTGTGTGTSTSTGTAQAPPAHPHIAQLDAQIAEGTRKAKQAAALGYESLSTRYHDDVQRLQAEKNRLDAPRQEFLKKQAVQDLELEQKRQEGVARAQLEADTKPATNAEIDAINRGLPRDKQLSYGTTYKEIKEKKLVGGGLLDPTVTKDIINTTTAIQNFEELNKAVQPLPTGPLTQYVEQFKERWGIDISDEKVAQRAILAGAKNQLLTARSGTAVSPTEYTRLMNELPDEGNDPKVFKARLANTLRQFKNTYKTRMQVLRKLGHAIPDDLMEPLPAPEGPPAPTVSSVVDKFKAIKP